MWDIAAFGARFRSPQPRAESITIRVFLSAIGTSLTNSRLAEGVTPPDALVDGFQRGLLIGSAFMLVGALIGLRTTNTRALQDDIGAPGGGASVHLD